MKTSFNDTNGAETTVSIGEISDSPQMHFDMASIGAQAVVAQGSVTSADIKDAPGGTEGGVLERAPITKQESKVAPKRPSMYKVMLHNDDTTPFDFVIKVLKKHFDVPPSRAQQIMWAAHQEGRSVVALYAKEIAEAKVNAANSYSRSQENPVFRGPMQLTFSAQMD